MLNKILFYATILFITQFVICDKLKCGNIYDGLTEGKYDLQSQYSNSTISANWNNFSDDVLFHEWAIVSDKINLQAFRNGGCIKDFRGIPDIQYWKNVNKLNQGINSKLQLRIGTTYYSLLRTTFSTGEQLFTRSNGVEILSPEFRKENRFVEFSAINPESKKLIERATLDDAIITCPIDESNQCRNAQISVGEKLNEIYGAPNFETNQLVELVIYGSINPENNGNDDDDDDDQAPAWILAPVIVGSFLFYCIILLLALLGILLFRRNSSPAEERPASVSFNEQQKESKAYGQREGMDVVDATTETRVEFPDTNIRRLSISHDNAPDGLEGGEKDTGKGRKHPIMSSGSSSFRDYRG